MGQLITLQNRVNKLDWLVVQNNITVHNGTGRKSTIVHLTRGATALEALERVATVEVKIYPGLGAQIQSINGVSSNQTAGKYWLIAKWNESKNNWQPISVGVSKYELENKEKLLFWYGKTSQAPFNLSF